MLCKVKYTASNAFRQALFAKKVQSPDSDVLFSLKIFNSSDLLSSLSELTDAQVRVLDYVLGFYKRTNSVYMSQGYIARHLDLARETINRAIKKLISLGLLKSYHRSGTSYDNDSLLYVPNKSLFKFRHVLNKVLFSLKSVPFWVLKKLGLITNVTPLRRRDIFLPSLYTRVRDCAREATGQLKKFIKQEGSTMSEVQKPNISPTLREITQNLRLTKLGQVKLLTFSDEILRQVWLHCKTISGLKEPFQWIMTQCIKQYQLDGSRVDWNMYHIMLERFCITDDKVYVQAKPQQEPKKVAVFSERIPEIVTKGYTKLEPHPFFAQEFQTFIQNS